MFILLSESLENRLIKEAANPSRNARWLHTMATRPFFW